MVIGLRPLHHVNSARLLLLPGIHLFCNSTTPVLLLEEDTLLVMMVGGACCIIGTLG